MTINKKPRINEFEIDTMFLSFRDRERPKYQVKEDQAAPRNGPRGMGEASDTVKVAGDLRGEETNQPR